MIAVSVLAVSLLGIISGISIIALASLRKGDK